MSIYFRALLICVSLLVVFYVLRKIKKLKVRMEDSIFWLLFAAGLVLIAIFPQIIFFIGNLFGIISPANLVFLIIIALALFKIFTLSMQVSLLLEQVKVLSAELALRTVKETKEDKE